jgi:hypothetical protein
MSVLGRILLLSGQAPEAVGLLEGGCDAPTPPG